MIFSSAGSLTFHISPNTVLKINVALFLGTGMTSEALGVSVAPSFFHSCVSDGKTATMEDVQRFKVGSLIICHMSHNTERGFI